MEVKVGWLPFFFLHVEKRSYTVALVNIPYHGSGPRGHRWLLVNRMAYISSKLSRTPMQLCLAIMPRLAFIYKV